MTYDISRARAPRFPVERVGIRTEYRGVLFRSRLEAKWAAFFHLLRWDYAYEPLDLAAYIPDFIVSFPRAPLLVEVKPGRDIEGLSDHAKTICRSGWRGDFLIVGERLLEPYSHGASFGLLGLWDHESEDGWQPADHAIGIDCKQCGRTTMMHASAEWFCVGCGAKERRAHFDDSDPDELEGLWAQASNAVQWRGA